MDAKRISERLDNDGFALVPGFFERELAERGRAEVERLMGEDSPDNLRYGYQTLHVAIPGKSRVLDDMLEAVLAHPETREAIQRIAGRNFKIRDINVRRMTGIVDAGDLFNPPLEWHRDAPLEAGLGILLTDVEEGDGPTGFVKGSHKFAADPRWDVILGMPFYLWKTDGGPWPQGLRWLSRLNPLARLLWRTELAARVASATGSAGDIYLFMNQTWHSRMPNIKGRNTVVILAGLFPSESPFPFGVREWPEEILQNLPPNLADALRGGGPPNEPSDTLLAIMHRERTRARPFSLFWLAALEKSVISALSFALQSTIAHPRVLGWTRRIYARMLRIPVIGLLSRMVLGLLRKWMSVV